MSTVKLLRSWDTEYSADSVEWCPNSKFHNLFVCGTYKLEEGATPVSDHSVTAQQRRVGRLYLFSCQNIEPYLVKKQTIETAAILDCKWCPVEVAGRILLAVADADCKVSIYQLNQGDENNITLDLLVEKLLPVESDENKLALAIDWSVRLHCDSYDKVHLAVSDSKGAITIFLLSDDALEVIHHWTAHEYEAWIVSFNHWNSSVIYTGGDDCRLCVYDLRCGTDNPLCKSRLHSAGVTSMNYNPYKEYLFSSGSYDENILLWDTRQLKRSLGSINVGGGVWRLKWDPEKGRHLLAACMYNGFRVIDCLDNCSPKITAKFNEHESIAYGSDWYHSSVDKLQNFILSKLDDVNVSDINAKLISTCSFYDHKLCVSLFVE